MPGFIADGYTRTDGYVASPQPEKNGEIAWEPVEFCYRPAARMDLVKLDAEIRVALRNEDVDPSCAERAEKLAGDFTARRVCSWTLTKPGGEQLNPTADPMR